MAVSSMCNLHVQRRWEALSLQPRLALKQTLLVFNALSEAIHRGRDIDIGQVGVACTSLVTALNDNHIQVILDAVRDHDDYTFVHCLRVSTFLAIFGHVTGLPRSDQVLMATGGLLHDIGKMSIAYDLLNKPGQLSRDEFEVVKTHVTSTVELVQRIPHIRKPIITIASQHQLERLDGHQAIRSGLNGSHLDELARRPPSSTSSALLDRSPDLQIGHGPEIALTPHGGKHVRPTRHAALRIPPGHARCRGILSPPPAKVVEHKARPSANSAAMRWPPGVARAASNGRSLQP